MLLLQLTAAALLCGRLVAGTILAPQGALLPPPFANKGRLTYAKPQLSSCCQGPQSPLSLNINEYFFEENQPLETAQDERPFPISPPGAPKPDDRTVYQYLKETGE